jgi:hypothetical protein
MAFFNTLSQETMAAQQAFLSRPIIQQTLSGDISLARYQAFLTDQTSEQKSENGDN